MKLYAIEAECDAGWKFDDYAYTDMKDAKVHVKRLRSYNDGTNCRIAVYVRTEGATKMNRTEPKVTPEHVTQGYWSHPGTDAKATWIGRCSCGATWTTNEKVEGCPTL